MLTMIIADDEAIARKSLELFIRKEFADIEVIAMAQDGIELVRLVEKEQPDMAIVDINMPGLNGIEAIEILHNKGIRTRFIIHTAYGEFAYVKKALEMKVDGYLLKPENREDRIKTIQKLCEDIRKRKNENKEKFEMKTLLHEVSPVLEQEILFSIMAGKPEAEKFATLCQVKGLEFNTGCMVTLLTERPAGRKKNNRKEVEEVAWRTLKTFCDYLSAYTEFGIMLLLFIPKQIAAEQTDAWIWDVIHLLTDELRENTGIDYRFGAGKVYTDFDKMPDSYVESLEKLKNIREKSADSDTGESPDKTSIYVERAAAYIDGHFTQDISLECVSEAIKISPFYLCRLMKQEMGVTFVEYLTKIRMEEAKRLSMETALSVKEIAERCGYSNDTYFCKVFKKYTGKTIGDYRRNL